MDARYFLKSRTGLIRFFHAEAAKGYAEVQRRIEAAEAPYDNPPWDDSGEPAFLSEWLDANTATEMLGTAAIAMLSDSLKLYFKMLEERVIGFSFENRTATFRKKGFVRAYVDALGEILDTDWSDCPADLDLIEQIVLTRNRAQHGEDLTSFDVTYDQAMLDKHKRPFFISDEELSALTAEEGSLASMLMPTIRVDGPRLDRAIAEVDALADWIDSRGEQAYEWRLRQRSARDAETSDS